LIVWTVYIVSCADGSLYTGIARNLDDRVKRHNTGRGAKYTRSRRPVELVYSESVNDHTTALRREFEIKKLERGAKKKLIESKRFRTDKPHSPVER
jgi:putative endonuclease